jgi:hypothetical protein
VADRFAVYDATPELYKLSVFDTCDGVWRDGATGCVHPREVERGRYWSMEVPRLTFRHGIGIKSSGLRVWMTAVCLREERMQALDKAEHVMRKGKGRAGTFDAARE